MATILVVEDEPTIRTLICEILGASHECHPVRTAEEGLELLAAGRFDVAITDVKLPGMDGDEFMRRAHEVIPSLPVILISGGYGYDEVAYEEEGAFGYLLKPFRAEELEALVVDALGSC
jgi:DNA-binding NtrC family response regulator